ncbi:hypothetical protein L226DRAFT_573151, partial [Lentinus tigrinus ALCF2SS1-7]|uniref:uncharacterized protein n=1 Tax=Lentinus tigrinus ALCF2SS1-7 TaxID=1328758 RepID=UPI0011663DA1
MTSQNSAGTAYDILSAYIAQDEQLQDDGPTAMEIDMETHDVDGAAERPAPPMDVSIQPGDLQNRPLQTAVKDFNTGSKRKAARSLSDDEGDAEERVKVIDLKTQPETLVVDPATLFRADLEHPAIPGEIPSDPTLSSDFTFSARAEVHMSAEPAPQASSSASSQGPVETPTAMSFIGRGISQAVNMIKNMTGSKTPTDASSASARLAPLNLLGMFNTSAASESTPAQGRKRRAHKIRVVGSKQSDSDDELIQRVAKFKEQNNGTAPSNGLDGLEQEISMDDAATLDVTPGQTSPIEAGTAGTGAAPQHASSVPQPTAQFASSSAQSTPTSSTRAVPSSAQSPSPSKSTPPSTPSASRSKPTPPSTQSASPAK